MALMFLKMGKAFKGQSLREGSKGLGFIGTQMAIFMMESGKMI